MLSAVLILSFISSLAAFSVVSKYASTKMTMSQEGFSKSLPFLKKPKNLDGLIVSCHVDFIIVWLLAYYCIFVG